MAKEILVRIEDGRGTMVRVVSGSVWITEEGDPRDRFMAAGARLAIASAGVTLVMVAVVYGSGQVIEGFFFTPRLVGERIGLHPLAVIFALLAFAQLFGFLGVLVALPAPAVLLVAIRRVRAGYMGSRLYQG